MPTRLTVANGIVEQNLLNTYEKSYTVESETLDSISEHWQLTDSFLPWNCLFVLPVWLKPWWDNLGGSAALYLLSVRHEGRTIGIAPLQRSDDTVRLIGDENVCDYLDYLDLYVTSYVDYRPNDVPRCVDGEGSPRYCDPSLFRGAADRMYLNDGGGRFADVSSTLPEAAVTGRGLGVVMIDLDGDRAPEIYVANDLTPNALLHADGSGNFTDASLISGAAVNSQGRSEAGMGVAVLDVGGDLDPDLALTNFDVETNTLYENLGELSFRDISAVAGFGPPSLNYLGFGLVALDLDLDGSLDLWVANGHIFDRPNRDNTAYAQPSQLLLQDDGRFRHVICDITPEPSWLEPWVARGAAAADFDNDGDTDLAVQQNGRPVRLVANRAKAAAFLAADVLRSPAGAEAIGASVTLVTSKGSRRQWVVAGDSYLSASDRRRQFALAPGEGVVALEVTWRSGRRLRLVGPPSGATLRLIERLIEPGG